MKIVRRTALAMVASIAASATLLSGGIANAEMPAPLDNPGDVKIALVRYLSTGDFFQAYLSGVEAQAEALGVVAVITNWRLMDASLIQRLHARGWRALVYTVNDAAVAERLIADGIDGEDVDPGAAQELRDLEAAGTPLPWAVL